MDIALVGFVFVLVGTIASGLAMLLGMLAEWRRAEAERTGGSGVGRGRS